MTLAVLTTVYPAAAPYLADFAHSLAAQDDGDFILYVGNDGLDNPEPHFSVLGRRTRIVSVKGTVAEVRQQLLRRIAADGHDRVVFADSDDHFSPERIAVARAALRQHEVVVNELVPFGAQITSASGLLGRLFKPGASITWRDLLDHNVCGLTNTAAVVAAVVPHSEQIATDIQAFDWALFTRTLFHGARAIFTDRAITHYRQHGANVGLTRERDAAALAHAVRIKARHYRDLAALDPAFAARATVFSRLDNDPAALSRYVTAIAAQPPAPGLWWSAALLPKESPHAPL